MRSMLVTGASGFVGRHLVAALRNAGHRAVEHSSREGNIANCQFPSGQVDHVFHLAAKMFVPASWRAPADFYEVNVMGTVNVLEYCRKHSLALTFASSYVYGQPEYLPISEGHPLRAVNPYGHTKLLAEDVCGFYHTNFQVPVTVIRPFNIYGPGQTDQFLIPSLIQQALSPSPCITVSDTSPRRDHIYISDLIDLFLTSEAKPKPGIYNAGSGRSHSIAEIVNLINKMLPIAKPLKSRGETRPNEIPDVIADISKASAAFGWTPRVHICEGIRRTMEAMSPA